MTKLTNAAALRSVRWEDGQQGFIYSVSVHLSHTDRRLSVSHFLDNALHFLDNASRLQCPFVTRRAEWVHRRGLDFRLGAEVALLLTG
jgi:hypothetical protein